MQTSVGAPSADLESQDDRRRRPADVYLPRGVGGARRQPAALDWAVTSGLRADQVEHVASGSADILAGYADFKMAYKDTKQKCDQQGINFLPLVIEAHGGGWGASLCHVVSFIASQQKAAGDWCREPPAVRMAQRISTTLQRANARPFSGAWGILRRLRQTSTQRCCTAGSTKHERASSLECRKPGRECGRGCREEGHRAVEGC